MFSVLVENPNANNKNLLEATTDVDLWRIAKKNGTSNSLELGTRVYMEFGDLDFYI